MENETLAIQYRNAPLKVRVGRVMMIIGCVLMFLAAFGNLLNFIVGLIDPSLLGAQAWNIGDPSASFAFWVSPLLVIFFVVSGIGGISFVTDKGPFKRYASLAAVVFLVVILIDTFIAIRHLGHGIGDPDVSTASAWINFALGMLDVQLSGGIYFIGWFLAKDYVGD